MFNFLFHMDDELPVTEFAGFQGDARYVVDCDPLLEHLVLTVHDIFGCNDEYSFE